MVLPANILAHAAPSDTEEAASEGPTSKYLLPENMVILGELLLIDFKG